MTVVTRSDGVKFVVQAYRERLLSTHKRLLMQEIRQLSEHHGQYICLMRKVNRDLEAAFSKERGYLLGELVWRHFGSPSNMIYCEAIATGAHCFLVVVSNNLVYLDNKLLLSDIYEELKPLFVDGLMYEVYTYGDVSLRDTDTFGGATFQLPKDKVLKFDHLAKPVFPELRVSAEYELQPLPLVLKSKHLRDYHRIVWVCILLLAAVLLVFWLIQPSISSKTQDTVKIQAPKLSAYEDAMLLPSPESVIDELTQKIGEFYLIPGWEVDTIQVSNQEYVIDLQAHEGSFIYLTDWAKRHYYDFHITPEGVQLKLRSTLPHRQVPGQLNNLQIMLDELMDRMRKILADDAIHVLSTQSHGTLQETRLMIHLDALSPDVLDLVGQELNDLPVSLSSVDLHFKQELIDGKIYLSVWGK